ncbi:MAG TPA: extracellular solute-binding protein [Candidatus Lumbricidophila sp.]|nr:extracellular solute-binding protein [Candidatus Lumbricidophila sp.]
MAPHTMKRGIRVALAATTAVALGLTFSGCSKAGGSASTEAADKGGTLKIYSDNPQWKDGFIAAGEEIKKTTGWDFDPTGLSTTENYTSTVLASLPTKKTGDIIKWWSGKQIQGLAATGQLEDLTSIWDKAVADGNISNDLRSFYEFDGKVYALPFVQSYWVMFYSKTLFKQAGIAGVPKTWAEFEAAAEKLKGIGAPMCTGQTEGWTPFIPFEMFLGAVSPQAYNDLTSNKIKWDDASVKEAMSIWKKWIASGWTTAPDTKTFDCMTAMKAGKVGMQPIGTWANGLYKTAGLTADEYGAFLVPSTKDGAAPGLFLEGGAIAIPKNAPNKAGALKAAAAWLTPEVQAIWSEKATGDSSPNAKVKNADPIIADIVAQIAAAKPTLLNRYYESLPPKLMQATLPILGGFMVDSDADKALGDIQKVADTEWKAWEANPSLG